MTLTPTAPLDEPAPRRRRGRRTALVAGGLALAAVAGGGAWGYHFWTAQGPQPAEALPGNTLAYVSVDLDPPGGQKVAAYDALRKFPALKKELRLGSSDDLGKSLVEEIARSGDCDLDYDEVRSWAGQRFAFAVVAQKRPEPVGVIAVDDEDEARAGLKKVVARCGADELGFAVGDGWAVLARNDDVASKVVADAHRSTLADDGDYHDLVGRVGDAGVVTVYAAPEAGRALLDAAKENPFLAFAFASPLTAAADPVSAALGMVGLLSADDGGDFAVSESAEMSPEEKALSERFAHYDELTEAEQKQLTEDAEKVYGAGPDVAEEGDPDIDPVLGEDGMEVPAELRKKLEGFTGLGGVARFDDGSLELEVVGDPMISGGEGVYAGSAGGQNVADLPDDTAAAFGAAFADGWADRMVESLEGRFLYSGQSKDEVRKSFEKATGLSIPDDLEALGGDSIAVVGGGGFDPRVAEDRPEKLQVAVRILGEPAKIQGALTKLRTALGKDVAPWLRSQSFKGGVVVGPDEDYLDQLAGPDGTRLADSDRFERAVPDAGDAASVTYLDFDAGDWLADLAESDEERRNLAPLDNAGLSVTTDGSRQRMLLRVTLDR
ncbi:MAG TPA: hypothetical protein VNS81_02165 [Nocardioides sp.]|nr:hypothetical protein [Nocardioides sp.]